MAQYGSEEFKKFRCDLICALKETGFKCRMCGECCRVNTPDSNLIILSAQEVREIMAATGLKWEDVAVPYPDMIEDHGTEFTFDWCIKRNEKGCIFQGPDNRCTIYKHRPWICRTYPLMLADRMEDGIIVTNLVKSECAASSYDNEISSEEAEIQADDLIYRKVNEDSELAKIKEVYKKADLSNVKKCVIDSEGVKEIK